MTSVISNNLNLKYQRFASSGCTDIGIRILGFTAKTQFLKLLVFTSYSLRFLSIRNAILDQLELLNNELPNLPIS